MTQQEIQELNYTLHKLPEGFVISSDEKPLIKGDKVYNPNIAKEYTKVDLRKEGKDKYSKGYHEMTGVYSHVPTTNPIYKIERKVITQQDQIDFSTLSEEEQREVGWFDVDKLYRQYFPKLVQSEERSLGEKVGFKIGCDIMQGLLSDRRFTLEEAKKIYYQGHKSGLGSENSMTFEQTIQSLSQPKSWKIEGHWENDKFKITKLL